MSNPLKGKNVVVLGASRGIGREIARRAHGERAFVLAVLILADVVGWSPQEIVSPLGGSVASVNSVLQRAREAMRSRYHSDGPSARSAEDIEERALLNRYVEAWESSDLDTFVNLLKEDATYAMPPWRQCYQGREAIRWFFGNVRKSYDGFRLVPTYANGQPAFGLYSRAKESASWNAHSLQVLCLGDGRISTLTLFMKSLTATLFPAFRLPLILPR